MHYLPAFIVALLCTLATLWATAQPADAPPAAHDAPAPPPANRLNFTPNPRYTVFDGPLREDGTIDYVAALNEHYSEGVTKENNAFRAMFLLMSREFRRDDLDFRSPGYLAMVEYLKISEQELEENDPYLSWFDFAEANGLTDDEMFDIEGDIYDGKFDHPKVDVFQAWINQGAGDVDRLMGAIALPKYWAPVHGQSFEGRPEILAGSYGVGEFRRFARSLDYRIKWSVHTGDPATVVSNLSAMYHLGGRISHGPMLIDALVAYSIDALTIDTLYFVLQNSVLSENDLDLLWRRWNGREAMRPLHHIMNTGARVSLLEGYLLIASGKIALADAYSPFVAVDSSEINEAIAQVGIDIDHGAARLSRYMTHQASVLQAPTYAAYQRVQAMREETVFERLDSLEDEHFIEDDDGNEHFVLGRRSVEQDELTELLVDVYYGIVARGHLAAGRTMFRLEARRAVALTAIAAEHYRVLNGHYPDRLERLVPDYFDNPPIDPMDGEPLRYRVEADGTAVVYSIFTNLEDDGGTTDVNDWPAVQDGDYVWRLTPPEVD